MKHYRKLDFPVAEIRRFLEPGPIVLVSSYHKGETNIMTMGWHTVLEFSPSLIGCMITSANYSHDLIRKSRECVINIPTADLIDTVVGIGNTDGNKLDKFEHFGLTPAKADKVKAPLISECYANIECQLMDEQLIDKYNFFIFKAVKAHAPARPKYPTTLHYRGEGVFMISGKTASRRSLFRDENL
jgi:flavin reductase (DIM6/NTAB) family NADH-FMN oxidoreductase RutF